MVDDLVINKLKRAFPNSFVNSALEFIAEKKSNEYFRLDDCKTELDVKCKVLEWLSRAAHKTCPFRTNLANERFHNFMLNGINDFLGTDFTEVDMQSIYTWIGCNCNREKTIKFINSGYDMAILSQ